MRPHHGVDVRADVARLADAELRALWQLYRDGVVREMYSPAGPGAVLVLEADSVRAAESHLAALPLLANGVVTLEVTELHPFAAFQMLFSGSAEAPRA